ncbi:hypothetical protein [Loigolactobacillus bifermentans]|uniref:Uncharacterized protein n=1 Tax=Loigolactobacillus bifermentans DSM 20003 TaxID=1423726 RepID=A0A0R1GNY1_9LACO|nr:hypothetical protein [Loigolactobacillus bifermentans]KRK32551.1 hypothetical protein FC07_GL001976 [Loigolactobacillus bifermentans DSM 20003]QGG60222.1 hypothetical protein LB003_07010 [Loigolactobacillus bifermentans]
MQFGNFSNSWYRISLDTDAQIFYATSKEHPEQVASGITIDEAVHNLSTANFSNRGQQLKHETA